MNDKKGDLPPSVIIFLIVLLVSAIILIFFNKNVSQAIEKTLSGLFK